MRTSRRVLVVVVLAAALSAPVVFDGAGDRGSDTVFSGRPAFTMPMLDPATALSSSWFCAGGSAAPDGNANVTVVVANATDEPRSGRLTWVPSDGEPVTVPIELPPLSRIDARATNRIQAAHVAAVVEVDGGGVAVEHTVAGPAGADAAACSPSASDSWYLANGATTKDAVLHLAIFNPFAGDAVLDVAFATNEGLDEPEAVQAYVVPARSLRVIDVTQTVRRRTSVATTVRARTGRVVVEGIQTFDGSEGRRGLGLTPAAPAPGEEWWFSEGLITEGVSERFHVYNPGDGDAVVEVNFVLEPGRAPVEPVEVTVPPRSAIAVDAAESGVPADSGHAANVRSLNSRPVVVERELAAGPPAGRRGYASTLGARSPAEQWVLAAGEASDAVDEWLIVHNPGSSPATVSVVALAGGQRLPIEGLDRVDLVAAGRLAVRMGDRLQRPQLALLVRADVPVVVERSLFAPTGVGLSAAIGLPVRR